MRCLSVVTRVAKRQGSRPCFCCRLPIRVGDTYVLADMVDHVRYSTKSHAECDAEVKLHWDAQTDPDGYPEGCLVPGDYFAKDDLSLEWQMWYESRTAKEVSP